jgi:hypothetical protein
MLHNKSLVLSDSFKHNNRVSDELNGSRTTLDPASYELYWIQAKPTFLRGQGILNLSTMTITDDRISVPGGWGWGDRGRIR